MKNKSWPIICSLLLCSTLSNGYAGEDYVDAYTPGTSSKMGLLKTAIVGIGLMAIPRSVNGDNGFIGCYKGTIDPKKSITTNTLSINTIGYSPCAYGQIHTTPYDFILKNIDMKMTTIPTYGADTRVGITNIEFSGCNFSTSYSASFNWQPINLSLPFLNAQFFLNIYDDQICKPILSGSYASTSCQRNVQTYLNGKSLGLGNNLFYTAFSYFMNND